MAGHVPNLTVALTHGSQTDGLVVESELIELAFPDLSEADRIAAVQKALKKTLTAMFDSAVDGRVPQIVADGIKETS